MKPMKYSTPTSKREELGTRNIHCKSKKKYPVKVKTPFLDPVSLEALRDIAKYRSE